MLKEQDLTQSQLAAKLGISRVRVTQILNLLELDESIQKHLLAIEDVKEKNFFTERKLRPIAIVKDKNEQIRKLSELVNDRRHELNKNLD